MTRIGKPKNIILAPNILDYAKFFKTKYMRHFIKCDKANHICDKIQYKEAKFSERILLKMHLMLCTMCRDYSTKNFKLSQSIIDANIKIVKKKNKEDLKNRLSMEILKNEIES